MYSYVVDVKTLTQRIQVGGAAVRTAVIFAVFACSVVAPALLGRVLEHARLLAGCDPQPVMDTWEEWATVQGARLWRFIFYKATVRQTWIQFMLQCSETEYELRDVTPAIGLISGVLLIIGLRALISRKVRRPVRKFVDQMAVAPEGLVPGNPLMEGGRMPRGQVAVAVKYDDNLHIVGGGVRMENHLITPTHNTMKNCELWIISGDREAKVDVETEIPLAADISAFRIPESTWSKLGIAQSKLGPLKESATVVITSSADCKYSVSTLKAVKPLGRVSYDGSTMPGFSGSAYMNGNVSLGLHVYGGYRGGGYELLYLWNRLKLALDEKPEDTSDFMYQQAKKGYEYEELADNQIVVRFSDGNYHRTDKDILARMRQLDTGNWADEMEYDELCDQLAYVPESRLIPGVQYSGEGQRPVPKARSARRPADTQSLPDSHLSAVKQERQPAKQAVSRRNKVKVSPELLKALEQRLRKSLLEPNASTGPQISQPMQSGKAS